MKWNSRRAVRGGWTLVEALVCIMIGATIFAAATELLGVALRVDSSGGRGTVSFQSLDRLAEQFRADVRDAIEARSAAPGAAGWTMQLPDEWRIEFAFKDHALLRTGYRADKVVQRDAFRLADEHVPRLELRPAAQPTTAALIFDRVVDGAPLPADGLRIEAPIGWERRFAASGKAEKAQ